MMYATGGVCIRCMHQILSTMQQPHHLEGWHTLWSTDATASTALGSTAAVPCCRYVACILLDWCCLPSLLEREASCWPTTATTPGAAAALKALLLCCCVCCQPTAPCCSCSCLVQSCVRCLCLCMCCQKVLQHTVAFCHSRVQTIPAAPSTQAAGAEPGLLGLLAPKGAPRTAPSSSGSRSTPALDQRCVGLCWRSSC